MPDTKTRVSRPAIIEIRRFPMKNGRTLFAFLLLAVASGALAQGSSNPPASAPAQTPAAAPASQPAPTLGSTVDRQVSSYEKLVVGVAEAMPEDKYSFTPASLNIPGAAVKDVRTSSQLIKHTATANYSYCGAATGEKPPESMKGP